MLRKERNKKVCQCIFTDTPFKIIILQELCPALLPVRC